MIASTQLVPDSYPDMLREIKVKIKHSRFKTALKINRELIELYWEIGKTIVIQQQTEGW